MTSHAHGEVPPDGEAGRGARAGAARPVEVISPTSHFRDMHAKTRLFAAAGVRHYWVVDPTLASGVVLTEFRVGGDGHYEIAASTNKVFRTDSPFGIEVDVPARTALRDDYRRAREDS